MRPKAIPPSMPSPFATSSAKPQAVARATATPIATAPRRRSRWHSIPALPGALGLPRLAAWAGNNHAVARRELLDQQSLAATAACPDGGVDSDDAAIDAKVHEVVAAPVTLKRRVEFPVVYFVTPPSGPDVRVDVTIGSYHGRSSRGALANLAFGPLPPTVYAATVPHVKYVINAATERDVTLVAACFQAPGTLETAHAWAGRDRLPEAVMLAYLHALSAARSSPSRKRDEALLADAEALPRSLLDPVLRRFLKAYASATPTALEILVAEAQTLVP